MTLRSTPGMIGGTTMKRMTVLAVAAVLIAGTAGTATPEHCALSTIAFTSTRDYPNAPLAFASSEIYLMNPDGTDPRRLTESTEGDALPKLSPDGKRIVFDSNRARGAGEPVNTSDLFLMKADGKDQTEGPASGAGRVPMVVEKLLGEEPR
jgi:hypothetical protein